MICARTHLKPDGDNKLTRLIQNNKAVYLIDYEDEVPLVNPRGVYSLINFLGLVRKVAKDREAQYRINYPDAQF